jgi:hypothetical protein
VTHRGTMDVRPGLDPGQHATSKVSPARRDAANLERVQDAL